MPSKISVGTADLVHLYKLDSDSLGQFPTVGSFIPPTLDMSVFVSILFRENVNYLLFFSELSSCLTISVWLHIFMIYLSYADVSTCWKKGYLGAAV